MRAALRIFITRPPMSRLRCSTAGLLVRDAPRPAGVRLGCGPSALASPQAVLGRRQVLPGTLWRRSDGARSSGSLARGAGATGAVSPPPASEELSWPQRDCGCGTLRPSDIGRRVTLCGWVDRQRNLGGVVFVDLRDHTGAVQVVTTPDSQAQLLLERVRSEYVITVTGIVRERAAANVRLDSGAVEVVADDVHLLNRVSKSLPFQVSGSDVPSEEVRLRRVPALALHEARWLWSRHLNPASRTGQVPRP
jgi:hypothetical protein